MLLGKRSRPEIRRTTSMTGISFDLTNGSEAAQEHSDNAVVGPEGQTSSYFLSMLSPRTPRRSSSGDFIEPAHFLRTCGLCKRRLASGRDIYMYRCVSLLLSLSHSVTVFFFCFFLLYSVRWSLGLIQFLFPLFLSRFKFIQFCMQIMKIGFFSDHKNWNITKKINSSWIFFFPRSKAFQRNFNIYLYVAVKLMLHYLKNKNNNNGYLCIQGGHSFL